MLSNSITGFAFAFPPDLDLVLIVGSETTDLFCPPLIFLSELTGIEPAEACPDPILCCSCFSLASLVSRALLALSAAVDAAPAKAGF